MIPVLGLPAGIAPGSAVAFPLLGQAGTGEVSLPMEQEEFEEFSNPNHSMGAAGMARGNWGDQSVVGELGNCQWGLTWAWEGQGRAFPSVHEQQKLMETQRHLPALGSLCRGVLALLQEGFHPK